MITGAPAWGAGLRGTRLLGALATWAARCRFALTVGAVAGAAVAIWIATLTVDGTANGYYATAVLAGTQSWKAFLFGALDAGATITVDKPPLAIQVMALSARLLGFSSFSLLLPQALAGAGSVLLAGHLGRRSFGPVAGVAAALALALTPVMTVVSRYDNPDALLVLVLLLAAWAGLRASETGRLLPAAASGALVGVAFDVKYLQALLIAPALVAVWLAFAPGRWRRRLVGAGIAALSALLAGGWWVALMTLLPDGVRPYAGGTADDSVLSLILGGNGVDRLAGADAGYAGDAGLLRLLGAEMAGQIAWLLPVALVGLAAGVVTWPRRGVAERRGLVLWGLWLGAGGGVLSLSGGIVHPYHSAVLAPAIAVLAGAAVAGLGRRYRASAPGWWLGPAAIAATGVLAAVILRRTPGFVPWLAPAVLASTALGAAVLVVAARRGRSRGALAAVVAAVALAGALAGPAAYSAATLGRRLEGGNPVAGPAAAGPAVGPQVEDDRGPVAFAASADIPAGLIAWLRAHHDGEGYLAAAVGAQAAAPIALATGARVLTIGGFNGWDPSPTAEELAAMTGSGEVRYVVVGAAGAPVRGEGDAATAARTEWLSQTCAVVPASAWGGSASGLTLLDCAP